MKLTIRENWEATIQDQLDEQNIKRLPLKVRRIHIIFYLDYDESDEYQEMKKEAILFNLMDYGILDDIEDIDVQYDVIYHPQERYRAELNIVL